ncbi:hypothetical protein [Mesorhizobium retamae]|uniref:Uncharacterized protein n=1 Tax=Mesorhizobium retamae TaxID=2912854 RepID=A0ABS9QM81_9HYPH|nr:hypothetical protein [Mesorhizobium sp. IRAMC:0171]MCG7508517.1 hypothetical protein [Mesorhizobium sp. IRAMC:0171]
MPTIITNLTGSTRHRVNWFGKMVLQVEVKAYRPDTSLPLSPFVDRMRQVEEWRDATQKDMHTLHLLDLNAKLKAAGEPPAE